MSKLFSPRFLIELKFFIRNTKIILQFYLNMKYMHYSLCALCQTIIEPFYVYVSVYRLSILIISNKMQHNAVYL